jgi:hypothetical protein
VGESPGPGSPALTALASVLTAIALVFSFLVFSFLVVGCDCPLLRGEAERREDMLRDRMNHAMSESRAVNLGTLSIIINS